jgi:hypothetical protein
VPFRLAVFRPAVFFAANPATSLTLHESARRLVISGMHARMTSTCSVTACITLYGAGTERGHTFTYLLRTHNATGCKHSRKLFGVLKTPLLDPRVMAIGP